jgi:hypothetical protein
MRHNSFFSKIFPFIFGGMFLVMLLIMLLVFVAGIFLSISCYAGGDPNSMACFMISERVEIGIRHR